MLQPDQKAGQRAGMVGQAVGPDRYAKGLIGGQVAVGADHHAANLGLQSP